MTKIPIEDESTPESTEESSQDDYENSYNDENNDIYQEDYEYEENGGYADNNEDYYPPEDYVEQIEILMNFRIKKFKIGLEKSHKVC